MGFCQIEHDLHFLCFVFVNFILIMRRCASCSPVVSCLVCFFFFFPSIHDYIVSNYQAVDNNHEKIQHTHTQNEWLLCALKTFQLINSEIGMSCNCKCKIKNNNLTGLSRNSIITSNKIPFTWSPFSRLARVISKINDRSSSKAFLFTSTRTIQRFSLTKQFQWLIKWILHCN